MPNSTLLTTRGLHSFNNYLGSIPEGALLDAANVIIDKDGVIEPRRGIVQYGDIGNSGLDTAKQLLYYKDRVLAHYSSSLAYDDGTGTFTPFMTTVEETESGLRIKFVESNGNLYLTTSTGIRKISTDVTANLPTATISDAGGIKAITGTATTVYGGPTFMGPFSKVAYRITWGTNDINGNFIEGSPSPAIEVTNQSSLPAAVSLTFQVPNGINTNHFYRIYRTNVATQENPSFDGLSLLSTGDEMRLVIQENFVSGTSITVTDITPEDFRDNGVNLYSNEFSGEGILQANEPPPFAKDIALYKNIVFYANTRTRHKSLVTLLGLSGIRSLGGYSDLIDVISITYLAPNTTITFDADPEITVGTRIVILGSGSPTLDGVQVVTAVGINSITVMADGTGASPANVSIYPSSVATTYGLNPSNFYYFVGRPEINQFQFPVASSFSTMVSNYITMYSSENANKFVFYFQTGAKEETLFTFPAPTSLASSGTASYVELYSAADQIHYVFYFQQGTVTPPVVMGATLVPVDISAALTSTQVAQAFAAVLPAADFTFTPNPVVANTVTTINVNPGITTDATSSDIDITVNIIRQGTNESTIPVFNDAILVPVDIRNAVTAAEVAQAFADAVDLSTFDFVVDSIVTDTVVVRNANSGAAIDATSDLVSILITKLQDGQGEDLANNYVRLSTFDSPAQSIDDTARSLSKVITANPSDFINAFYIFKADGLPGQISLEAKELEQVPFTITASDALVGESFNPNLTLGLLSTNEERKNRLYYSKPNQPEAVPLVNFFDVGPKDKAILRIIALTDSLFILKEDAIYRLTGNVPSDFFPTIADNSAYLIAADTAAVLNNQIYALTSQGVAAITENGVDIRSRQIEDVFLRVTSPDYVNYKTASFASTYESDRSYIIWVPNLPSDTTGTRAYRYNTFTRTWTYFIRNDTCAILEPAINKLYFGAADTNIVEVERKNLTRDDYADREYELNILMDAVDGLEVTLNNGSLAEKGDILIQRQYVTISQVERLANKFVLDNGVPNNIGNSNKDFYRNFNVAPGDNLQDKLSELITQLNLDIGTVFSTSYSADFITFQTEFNLLVAGLNANTTLVQNNYTPSVDFVDQELVIQEKIDTNVVSVLALLPIIQGPIVLLKAIKSNVVWAPMSFGDPSMVKQVREGTILFANAGIAFATIGYKSDLSTDFEDIDFILEGDGSWGVFFYGSTTWGGEGSQRPFRTLIPRQKQRCRFISARFKHSTGLYKFSILGISFIYNNMTDRGYK